MSPSSSRFRDRTVFVTGGAGFIGSALIRHLLDDTQARVVNIDKLTYAANLASIPQADGHNRYRFEKIDICDRDAVTDAFARYKPDAVFNLAAESHVDRSITGPDDFIQTNVVGAFVMLHAALAHWQNLPEAKRRDFRFVQISTDEVFGSLGETGLFTEATPYAPNSPYSASKAASDHLARAWRETYGLPTIVTNCSNNFGPYHFPEKLIPHIIIRALAGETLPVYGDGKNVRDWLYVEDHARALALVLERGEPGECYNIGARSERQNIDVVSAICDLLDEVRPGAKAVRRGLITFVPDRPGHDRRYAIDPSKIERELGWRPLHPFEESLARTVRWYCENEGWWRAILERGYKAERLGLKVLKKQGSA